MASSPDYIDTKNFDKDYTPQMIAEELKLGDKFVEWLSKEKFSEESSLLVLDYVGIDLQNQDAIKNALIANKAEATIFDTIFKFKNSRELRDAKRGVKYAVPWVFYNSTALDVGYQGPNREWIEYTRKPTILTSVVLFFDYKIGVLSMQPSDFFEA
ncbi:unnamed protein product [Meloidogyne enterolobii]|uniref:Uncharacterized protein n=1 Tax=Meloidogyne enterolobii TaxID=390850 RepID=A0ACB0XNL4_MELEN